LLTPPAGDRGVVAAEQDPGDQPHHGRGAASMKPENQVTFGTAGEAEAAGYRKAGDCDYNFKYPATLRWSDLIATHGFSTAR